MQPGVVVDLIIAFIVLAAMWAGWRQGAIASVFSAIGVVAGLLSGAVLAPVVMTFTDSVALRFLLALGTVILLVGVGNLVGGLLGSALRDVVVWRKLRFVDASLGSVFQAATALVVVWLVSIPLATGLSGVPAQGIAQSKVLGFVDRNTPQALGTLPSKISAMLSESGLPPLVSPFEGSSRFEVEAPDIQVEDVALVERLRPSVVHVMGESQVCSRRLMGSGFVVDDTHVVTNAHVVAGTNSVALDTTLGIFQAQVVYYNPELDIAVLQSEPTGLPALQWAQDPAVSGEDAIVMGFPESGPFEAAPARIADRLTISGPNIYASGRVEREAYTVRGTIRQGNSGGPMVNVNGEVIGVVFGAAVDNTDIGYALTAREVLANIGNVSTLTSPVGTMECVNN